jgi:hypothetical protein
MKNNWFDKKWASVTPLIILFILFSIYVLAQFYFVECQEGATNCNPIKPAYIFSTPPTSNKLIEMDGKLVQFVQENGELIKDVKQDEIQIRKVIADRYNGRLAAMFLIAANVLFCFIAFFAFFFLIKKSLNYKFAGGLITLSFLIGFCLSSIDEMPLLKPFVTIIENFTGGISGILNVVKFTNSIGYAATITFVFTICSILYSGNSTADKNNTDNNNSESTSENEEQEENQIVLDKKLQYLSNKKGDLEIALYVATLLLIVGVLRANAISSWSLTFMTSETVEIAKNFLTNLTTILGGFFTLLLAITYLPAIYTIQQRGKTLLEDSLKDKVEPSDPLRKTEFTFSLKDSLPRILAIIAPFLTGPIADLLKKMLEP